MVSLPVHKDEFWALAQSSRYPNDHKYNDDDEIFLKAHLRIPAQESVTQSVGRGGGVMV